VDNVWHSFAGVKIGDLGDSEDGCLNHVPDRFALPADSVSLLRGRHYTPGDPPQTFLPPVPYVGNPLTANVVVLAKNPGFVKEKGDREYANEVCFVRESLKALTFESSCPLHYLDTRFQDFPGAEWWRNMLGPALNEVLGNRGSTFASWPFELMRKVACLEFLPYHSNGLPAPGNRWAPLASQSYNRFLLEEALHRDAVVVFIYGNGNVKCWNRLMDSNHSTSARLANRAIRPRDLNAAISNKALARSKYHDVDFDRILKALNT
jgi:hypothetical protein